ILSGIGRLASGDWTGIFELTSGATSFGKSEGWETAQVITANLGNLGSIYQMSKATGGPGGGSGIQGMPFRPTGGSTSGNNQSIGLVLWTMFRESATNPDSSKRSQ